MSCKDFCRLKTDVGDPDHIQQISALTGKSAGISNKKGVKAVD